MGSWVLDGMMLFDTIGVIGSTVLQIGFDEDDFDKILLQRELMSTIRQNHMIGIHRSKVEVPRITKQVTVPRVYFDFPLVLLSTESNFSRAGM